MSAAEQLQSAEQQLAAAKAALVIARDRFLKHPNMKNEEAVETEERNVRRAERFRDARILALEQESAAAKVAQQAKAREQRAELLVKCGEVRGRIAQRTAEIVAIYGQLNDVVAAIDALAQEDAELCRAHNALGESAGERDVARPVDIEMVRLTLNVELGEVWDDKPRGDAELADVLKAASQLEQPGTAAQFYRRLEMVVAEIEHAFRAAPLCRWLSTLSAPTWNDHSPAAERTRQAIALREKLKEANRE